MVYRGSGMLGVWNIRNLAIIKLCLESIIFGRLCHCCSAVLEVFGIIRNFAHYEEDQVQCPPLILETQI